MLGASVLSFFCFLTQLGSNFSSVSARSFNRDTTPSTPTEGTIVDTGYAKYLGNYTAPYSVAFHGIPYAEPPLGDRRFRDPVPLDTDKLKQNGSVIDARNYTAPCVQGALSLGNVNQAGGMGSEDCLTMNIYTPINATSTSKCE